MDQLGLRQKDIAEKYHAVTGKKFYMQRHYFQDSQFLIPTEAVWDIVFEPLGFGPYEYVRKWYEELRAEYEDLREQYEKNGISGSQTTSIAMCGSSQIVYAAPREAFTRPASPSAFTDEY